MAGQCEEWLLSGSALGEVRVQEWRASPKVAAPHLIPIAIAIAIGARAWGRKQRGARTGPGSVLFFLAVMICPSALPPAHELDPIERRAAVPAFDKDRATEARACQRQFSPLRTTVGGPVGAARSISSEIPHHSPSDRGNIFRLFEYPLVHFSNPCPLYGLNYWIVTFQFSQPITE